MNNELVLIIPEIALLSLACFTLLFDSFSSNSPKHPGTYWLAQLTLLIVIALLAIQDTSHATMLFSNSLISDHLGNILKIFVCSISFIAFIYSKEYAKEHAWIKGEYYIFGLFAVLGTMIMISAYSMLTIYLGVELLSLSLYAMVALHKDSSLAVEAAVKYFVLGALASGILLYGISIIYGVTGTLELDAIKQAAVLLADAKIYLMYGVVFIIAGVAFKLGVAPFHMWLPDVYQGAPTSVTLFISAAPKIAALAIAIRLLMGGFFPLFADWQTILMTLAVCSIGIGNIVAIAQDNIKRMLAYSAIAHMGFVLLGLISGTSLGIASAVFYIFIYALMSIGAFGMIILLAGKNFEADLLLHFKGLADRSPWFSFIMLCFMFSMAGIPPFAGFWAKWFVLKELIASHVIWLAIIAVLFSVIGAFYYLRIVKLMYFDKPETTREITASSPMRFMLSVNGVMVLILGIAPNILMGFCVAALVR